jgi:hypothetical protein
MRELPPKKTHGIIHTVKAKGEDLDKIAEALGIPAKDRKWMHGGHDIHIVREAASTDINKNKT